jgi:tetratricopeptide (TPR) repeat protein
MNRRLKLLEKLVREGSSEPFHAYALALEYKREERFDEALATFDSLRAAHPAYLPMYMMAGLMLAALDRTAEATLWFEQGLEVARRQGDAKTARELEDALRQTRRA